MNKKKVNQENKRIHFIGGGGIGMSGLIKYLAEKGYAVSASDKNFSSLISLENYNVKTFCGHKKSNVKNADVVVYSSAIKDDNPELLEAKRNKAKILKRSQLLNQILSLHKISIGVAGSHGKTTATNFIAQMLLHLNKKPTVFLGGENVEFGNFLMGENIALAEVCEYKRNILDLLVDIAVVLNIDNDHLDTYKNVEEQIKAFNQFVKNSLAIINVDDKNARKLKAKQKLTVSLKRKATVRAKKIIKKESGYEFTLYVKNKKYGKVFLNNARRHNVLNALTAICVALHLNLDINLAVESLKTLSGVKRRDEYLGDINGVKVYQDYAHHPTEIVETLKSYGKDTLYIFQPHTYSRTKLLFNDFIKAFKGAKNLIIYKTYPARESFDENGDAKRLYLELNRLNKNVYYEHTINGLKQKISQKSANVKKIVSVGAGDLYEIIKNILKNS